ncbi:hypothetical protein ACFSTC_06050 [Nonomuraea ferruginea]
MTRSEYDDIRAFLADPATQAGDLLDVARTLVEDLEQARMREAMLRTHYLRLLTAARATVAAEHAGAPDPMTFVRHELDERGAASAARRGRAAHPVGRPGGGRPARLPGGAADQAAPP